MRLVPTMDEDPMAAATEGENYPHPVAPLPQGEGRILPVITALFLTPLPSGEGLGVRTTCSSMHRPSCRTRGLESPIPIQALNTNSWTPVWVEQNHADFPVKHALR